ncbi:AI-2E family transporter [Cyanobium sp. ATX 6A2]|uniref:AI-2E family transporter n=1 Tax=Cyanobium sp. ATX 6A2 TaxID=2823700 RepID=UPI0020CBC7DA|nr:AI-2E family transporter [Cyanobium sp. ATX 6A2]MCP9888653.1 AI-2E family transporter [Cyanobium sp. ATX 6A2]
MTPVVLPSTPMGFIPFGAIVVNQIIENVLPPRLLGKLTGLKPIVILFSVMVGATLADFVGMIT